MLRSCDSSLKRKKAICFLRRSRLTCIFFLKGIMEIILSGFTRIEAAAIILVLLFFQLVVGFLLKATGHHQFTCIRLQCQPPPPPLFQFLGICRAIGAPELELRPPPAEGLLMSEWMFTPVIPLAEAGGENDLVPSCNAKQSPSSESANELESLFLHSRNPLERTGVVLTPDLSIKRSCTCDILQQSSP